MKKIFFISLIVSTCLQTILAQRTSIRSGEIWPDDKGEHINAHGGGIMKYGDTYYWFGENKDERTCDALVGVMCYASKDLLNWRNCGVALSVSNEKGHDIEKGCILERPKVIYNPKTKKFCMWFHLELKGKGYEAARYGVAVADRPEGPYQYLYSSRANAGKSPIDGSPMNFEEYFKRDFDGGQMSRDMTLYVDDDGKAYHIFSSEENFTLHIAELTDDFLHHTGKYTRMAPGGQNEAPAIFKKDGTYWMITSGCTGWAPNEARMFSAPSIWGPWTQHPNPCRGPKADKTFNGQSTFILPVGGKYIFMADIWRPWRPIDGRYIWLPIEFENGKPVVRWRDEWNFATIADQPQEQLYTLKCGDATMTINPDKGGKILSLKYQDKEVLSQSRWPESFGSTFWTAPQKEWNWPPVQEFDKQPYSIQKKEDDRLVITSPVSQRLGLSVGKDFQIDTKDGAFVITYSIKNEGKEACRVAPWEITRVPNADGQIFFDAVDSIWPAGLMTFERANGAVWYKTDVAPQNRKVNADARGWLAYATDGLLLLKRFPDLKANEPAPGEAEVQVYVNRGKSYIELESQGAYTLLQPGESLQWTVRWYLMPADTTNRKEMLKKI